VNNDDQVLSMIAHNSQKLGLAVMLLKQVVSANEASEDVRCDLLKGIAARIQYEMTKGKLR